MYSLDFWAGGRLDMAVCQGAASETRIFDADLQGGDRL